MLTKVNWEWSFVGTEVGGRINVWYYTLVINEKRKEKISDVKKYRKKRITYI